MELQVPLQPLCVHRETYSVGVTKREKRIDKEEGEREREGEIEHLILIKILYRASHCTKKIFSSSVCFCSFFPNCCLKKTGRKIPLFSRYSTSMPAFSQVIVSILLIVQPTVICVSCFSSCVPTANIRFLLSCVTELLSLPRSSWPAATDSRLTTLTRSYLLTQSR